MYFLKLKHLILYNKLSIQLLQIYLRKNMYISKTLYKITYKKQINYVLRNTNYLLKLFLLEKLRIPSSGILDFKVDSGKVKIATKQTI